MTLRDVITVSLCGASEVSVVWSLSVFVSLNPNLPSLGLLKIRFGRAHIPCLDFPEIRLGRESQKQKRETQVADVTGTIFVQKMWSELSESIS